MKMRRHDREVTDPAKIREIIDGCQVCRLGFQDGQGVYVVPVNYGHVEENGRHIFYFHGAMEGRKPDLARKNGWAGIELDRGYRVYGKAGGACSYTAAFQSLIGEGPIREITDPEEKRRGLLAVMARATGREDWEIPDASVEKTCVLRLDLETFACKEHE